MEKSSPFVSKTILNELEQSGDSELAALVAEYRNTEGDLAMLAETIENEWVART